MKTREKEEFENLIKDIENNNNFKELDNELHHGISRYGHSYRVAKSVYIITKKLNFNYEEATRAALMHDFYFDYQLEENTPMKNLIAHQNAAVLNASKYFEKGKRQNALLPEHIDKIIDTYQYRKEDDKKYSRRVSMEEIEKNGYNLNISRYVSTAPEEEIVDIEEIRQELEKIEGDIQRAKVRHNQFLQELGLRPIP